MVKEDTVMRRKSLMVLGLVMSMSLSLPLLSYAQPQGIYDDSVSVEETCPLLINGQRVVNVGISMGASGYNTIRFGAAIMVGTDHLEESDLVVERGTIISSQLNVDNGKLTELALSNSKYADDWPNGKDSIEIRDNSTRSDWRISVFRLPDNMSSPEELGIFKEYAIIANGYQAKALDIGWQKNDIGYWYNEGNGVYPSNTWKEIDGKFYYFEDYGYMLSDCWTPDGYYVDASGAWIPGYDEELEEGAKVKYSARFIEEDGSYRYEHHEVPVYKVSDIINLFNNFKENEYPEMERDFYILTYDERYRERHTKD